MHWRTWHIGMGAIGLLVFILTGQYMAWIEVEQMPAGPRLMYRSLHIYFFLACALNAVAGFFLPANYQASWLQKGVSLAMLATPVLLFASFVAEGSSAAIDRPIAKMGLYLIFGAAVILLLIELRNRLR